MARPIVRRSDRPLASNSVRCQRRTAKNRSPSLTHSPLSAAAAASSYERESATLSTDGGGDGGRDPRGLVFSPLQSQSVAALPGYPAILDQLTAADCCCFGVVRRDLLLEQRHYAAARPLTTRSTNTHCELECRATGPLVAAPVSVATRQFAFKRWPTLSGELTSRE